MTTYRKEGKDLIIFATAEDHKEPSEVILPEPESQPGLILPNGEINWNCPCLGGMATGPCGIEFREAFSCFHNSEADPKGSDCYEAFKEMHLCMAEYPALYNKYEDKDADMDFDEEGVPQDEKLDKKAEPKGNVRSESPANQKEAIDLKETPKGSASSGEGNKQIKTKNVNT